MAYCGLDTKVLLYGEFLIVTSLVIVSRSSAHKPCPMCVFSCSMHTHIQQASSSLRTPRLGTSSSRSFLAWSLSLDLFTFFPVPAARLEAKLSQRQTHTSEQRHSQFPLLSLWFMDCCFSCCEQSQGCVNLSFLHFPDWQVGCLIKESIPKSRKTIPDRCETSCEVVQELKPN